MIDADVNTSCFHEGIGFGAAANVGMERFSDMRFVLVLCDDIKVSDTSIRHMRDAMLSDPSIGVAGSLVISENKWKIWNAGANISACIPNPIYRDFSTETKMRRQIKCDSIVGHCMMLRRNWEDEPIHFAEDYFLYFEDTDLCFQYRKWGFDCVTITSALSYHNEASSATKDESERMCYFTRNHLYFLARWYPKSHVKFAACVWLAFVGVNLVLLRPKKALGIIHGLISYALGHVGQINKQKQ